MNAPGPAHLAGQLGAILTRTRGERSRSDLARAAGVTPQALLAIEAGDRNPTLARVASLGALYGARLAIVDVAALEAALMAAHDSDPLASAARRRELAVATAARITNPGDTAP